MYRKKCEDLEHLEMSDNTLNVNFLSWNLFSLKKLKISLQIDKN